MRTYIRNRVPGGLYFFTVNLARRAENMLLIEHIDHLRNAYQLTCRERPFETVAAVVLPEHLHVIWRLPEGDDDYSTRWRLLKGRFSHAIAPHETRHQSRLRKGERGIWQRRYWEHTIRDEVDLHAHIDYIHHNPVKHGWCKAPTEWEFSTLHRHIDQGRLPADWGS
jgi:putative transposase